MKTKYAHRGLHNAEKPENSLAAFSEAAKAGYGMELDIHLTKDRRLAVMHDDNIKRMCGADHLISENDFASLSPYKLSGTNQKIPAFEEMLALVNGRVPLVIEFKVDNNNHKQLCEAAFKILDNYVGDYCVESFDPRVIMWLKHNRPNVVRGQLSAKFAKDSGLKKFTSFALTNLLFNLICRPDFIAYCFTDRNNLSLKFCRLLGAGIFYWTIKSSEDARTAINMKSAIIFENFRA